MGEGAEAAVWREDVVRVPWEGQMTTPTVTPEMRRAGIAAFRAWCQGEAPEDLGIYDYVYLSMERARIEQEERARNARLNARDTA
jgi:hypothetical protein